MPALLGSWCPQCGSNVSVDEDGCCNSCGCSAVGQGADEAHATIADLRDRLRILAPMVCEGCGCAPVDPTRVWPKSTLCADCGAVRDAPIWMNEGLFGAQVSCLMRKLCGRRILEGC